VWPHGNTSSQGGAIGCGTAANADESFHAFLNRASTSAPRLEEHRAEIPTNGRVPVGRLLVARGLLRLAPLSSRSRDTSADGRLLQLGWWLYHR